MTNATAVDDWNPNARTRRRIRTVRLEADMAYFQARLELIGEPRSNNQRAQRKVFELLHKALGSQVVREKKRLVDEASVK